ncbi:MAG TPA: TetR/AcrR family transcriptional regulator, partial [Longimicrobium sp.]|nr:TetR/AcrR family transcriptional regulator [Longimicrobium sp.]
RFAFAFTRSLARSAPPMPDQATATRTPRQPRSRQTEERILRAFSELLSDARFEDVSVQQVAGRAGVSVGGFYARFASKDDLLLHAMYAGYVRDAVADAERTFDPARWQGTGIAPVAEAYFALMLRAARDHVAVLRELVHRTRGNPETMADNGALAAFRQGVHEPFRRLLAERMGEVDHPDPPFALRFAFSACSSALRESALFGHMEPSMGPVDEDVMARELARMFCRYLGIPFPAGADDPARA